MLKTGIHKISAEAYHADPCEEPSLSASIAHVLLTQSPAHARFAHPRLNPAHAEDNDPKFDSGKALHALFLEGSDLLMVCKELSPSTGEPVTAWQTKKSKEFRAEARANGYIPVLAHQETELRTALSLLRERVESLDCEPAAFAVEGLPEQTLIWQEENGVWCRARPDWLHADFCAVDDLKIVGGSARPGMGLGQFGRAVWSLGHDIQAAFYCRGVKMLTGQEPAFRFVAFELEPPHQISASSLGSIARAIAETKVARAIALWGQCLEKNHWPGYPRWPVELEAPAYELGKWEGASEELF